MKSIDFHNILKLLAGILVITAIILITVNSATANQPLLITDSLSETPSGNYVSYGIDKITDTYLFLLNGSLSKSTNFGSFDIRQNYRGIGLKQNQTSFRDDQNFTFDYAIPLEEEIRLLARQNVIYSSDQRTSGNNVLSRVNSSIGASYAPMNNIMMKLYGGYEFNKQLSVTSPGLIFNLNGAVSDLKVSNFSINSVINGEQLFLNRNRTNSDLDFYSSVNWLNDEYNQFNINFFYRLMKRDMLSSLFRANDSIPVESRFENKFTPDIRVLFNLFPNMTADIKLNISNLDIEKSYKSSFAGINLSNVTRTFSELQYGINIETILLTNRIIQKTGMSYYSRTEENKVDKKFSISEFDLIEIQNQEYQRDNLTTRTRLFSSTSWMPDKLDTMSLVFSVRKLRYDTPSDKNFDDRDELSLNAGLSLSHRFDNSFSGTLFGELQMLHLVFIKSERSAMNNWNRIFRFGSEFSWNTAAFAMSPRIEVLANYTIYDFEDKTGNIRSYSYRQIGYRDSIVVKLGSQMSLQSKLSMRYFERGILYWDTFSESPQNSNLELFFKLLYVSEQWENCKFGLGGRMYSLRQANISQGTVSISNFNQLSLGPEVFLNFKFFDGSNISLQGWYEFQYINKLFRNNIPNLFLFTNIMI